MKQHIYYVKHNTDEKFIAIKHGDKGYYETDITDQGYCDGLNALGKNSKAECEAALVCSMSGRWENFDVVTACYEPLTRKQRIEQWQDDAQTMHKRARKLRDAIYKRAQSSAADGGLDPTCMIQVHNSLAGLSHGNPWPNVNYHCVRRAAYLMRRALEPNRLVSAVINRKYQDIE